MRLVAWCLRQPLDEDPPVDRCVAVAFEGGLVSFNG
jgi:hypothetical protein